MGVKTSRALVVLFSLFALAFSRPARAENVALAEALFQEGRRLMAEGDFAAACTKLEESLRIDRGTGTLWHLAKCYEKTNRLASAWAKFHEAAQNSRRQKEPLQMTAALKAANAIKPRLARLSVLVPKPNRIDGISIRRNGSLIRAGAWGTALPVDEGNYEIVAAAGGRQDFKTVVQVRNGETEKVEIPLLAPVALLPSKRDGKYKPWHDDPVGWTVTGVGVGLLAGGAASLIYSNTLATRANRDGVLLEDFKSLNRRSRNFRAAGVTLLSVGAVTAIIGGVKLALREKESNPRKKRASTTVSVRNGGFVLSFKQSF